MYLSGSVAACLIVRDAAEHILRCLESALPIVDRLVLVDTGSVDGTQAIIEDFSAKYDIPLELYEEPWVDFATNRSSLMRHGRESEAEWLLLLDSDMVVHADGLPDLDEFDCWEGRIIFRSLDYTLPFLVRASKPWFYEGVAHSYLVCEEPYSEGELPGFWVDDDSHTGVEKLKRDLEVLSVEHARDPLNARTAFYLAQTYFDLDLIPEAIQAYRIRAHMDGWDEETFYARHRLGTLLCEYVSFSEGAQVLLAAWESRPSRIEPLRALANVATNVADKAPYPADRLFVHKSAYARPPLPPLPNIAPSVGPRTKRGGLFPSEVSAILVTRGDQDMAPIIEPIQAAGITDIVIWDNSKREHDYKAFGRYAAIPEAKNPVIYWQDDDLVFTEQEALFAAYKPERLVCNMDEAWIEACGYRGLVGMQGAGSLCDADLPAAVFSRYLAACPWDDDAITEADFIFGVLCPFTVVDLPYQTFDYADGPDRLYTTPGQQERKWQIIERCRTMLAGTV